MSEESLADRLEDTAKNFDCRYGRECILCDSENILLEAAATLRAVEQERNELKAELKRVKRDWVAEP